MSQETVGTLEDVFNVCVLPDSPNTRHLQFVPDHIKALEKSIKNVKNWLRECEIKDMRIAIADLDSDIDTIISDVDDFRSAIIRFHDFAESAVDAVHDWKEVVQSRLTDDEFNQWAWTQAQNKMIEALGND